MYEIKTWGLSEEGLYNRAKQTNITNLDTKQVHTFLIRN